jgi:hypothetical protein
VALAIDKKSIYLHANKCMNLKLLIRTSAKQKNNNETISRGKNGLVLENTCPYANIQLLYPERQFSTIGRPAILKIISYKTNNWKQKLTTSSEIRINLSKLAFQNYHTWSTVSQAT